MNTHPTLYGYVMHHLSTRRYTQRQVAQGSGVPFSTICKIAQGAVKEPSVHTVQTLADWFRAQTETASSTPQDMSAVGFGEPRLGDDRLDDERRDMNNCPPEPCSFVGGFGEPRNGIDPRDDERRKEAA